MFGCCLQGVGLDQTCSVLRCSAVCFRGFVARFCRRFVTPMNSHVQLIIICVLNLEIVCRSPVYFKARRLATHEPSLSQPCRPPSSPLHQAPPQARWSQSQTESDRSGLLISDRGEGIRPIGIIDLRSEVR